MLLIVARLLQYSGALVLLGSALFCMYGSGDGELLLPQIQRRQWPRRILVIAALSAMAGTVLWVMAETVLFSGEPADGTDPAAVWVVFSETRFGRVCLLRLGLLFISLVASGVIVRRNVLLGTQAVLASVILATFAWTGHGAMTAGWPGAIHLGGDLVHLWAAGVWIGALPPLIILIWQAHRSRFPGDARAAQRGLEWFSAIGSAVVAALIVSGLINSWFLIGVANSRAVSGTSYGRTLLVKLGLFAVMLVLAAANRFWLTPRLRTSQSTDTLAALHALRLSVVAETATAVLVLGVIGVLGTLAPPISGE
ncbi:MAG: copper homeostasis membrane protein CopD [Pseudomonadota bacterium]